MKTLMESDVVLTMEHMLNDMSDERAEALGRKHLLPRLDEEKLLGSVADSPLIKRMCAVNIFNDHRADELRAVSRNEIDDRRAEELLNEAAKLDGHGIVLRNLMFLQIMHELGLWDITHIELRTNWEIVQHHRERSPGEMLLERITGGQH